MLLKILKYGWVPLIIAAIIFYLSCLIEPDEVPEVNFEFFIPADKMVHFIMYFGLSLATAFYYIYDKKGNIYVPLMLLGAIAIPILYGGLIEIIQSVYFSPRTGDWFDFLADTLGSLAALPLICWFRNCMLKRQLKYKTA